MKGIFERFKEPSSYAAITSALVALGINVDGSVLQAGVYIAAGLSGLIAFFMKEKGGNA